MLRLSLLLASIVASVALLVAVELGIAKHFPEPDFSMKFREKVAREKPDIIFIGNSTLGASVNLSLAERLLSEKLGKPIKVVFVGHGGMHSAWQYLALKNQIEPTRIKDIPIVLIDFEDYFLRPLAGTGSGGKAELAHKIMMNGPEPKFLEILGPNSEYYRRGFPQIFHQSFAVRRWATAEAVMPIIKKLKMTSRSIKPSFKATNELWLQAVLRRKFSPSKFRTGLFQANLQNALPETVTQSSESFEKFVSAGFIPEILAFQNKYHFMFVVTPSNPDNVNYDRQYSRSNQRLEEYLARRNVPFFDMNRLKEFQDPSIMHDSRHLNKGAPKDRATTVIVDAILKADLFNRKSIP